MSRVALCWFVWVWHGVCVSEQTDGASPLLAACKRGHVEVVGALLGAGAAVNQAMVRDHWILCQSPVVACVCE
jgi:hypothetical protein